MALRANRSSRRSRTRKPTGLEEIIVTARKVEENLQKTPISITALSGAALEDRQMFRTDVLDQVVPNLQFANNAPLAGNNSSSQVFIRGIGQTDPTSTVDPGVGLYIDDVYIGNAVGGSMAAARHRQRAGAARAAGNACSAATRSAARCSSATTDPGEEFGGKCAARNSAMTA